MHCIVFEENFTRLFLNNQQFYENMPHNDNNKSNAGKTFNMLTLVYCIKYQNQQQKKTIFIYMYQFIYNLYE